MKQIAEGEARNIVTALTGEDIYAVCTGGRNAYGTEVAFFQDENTGAVVIKDYGAQTVWEYDFHGGYLRHRGFGSSWWVAHAKINAQKG